MNTLRAYMDTDTALAVWLRDEDGKLAMPGTPEILVYLYPYGSSVKVEEAGIDGTPTTPGKVAFTVTSDYAQENLTRGSYRYSVTVDGVQRQDGLLEVV